MKTSKLLIIALALFMVTGSFNASADCLTGSMIDSCTGSALFGFRYDGVRLHQGQAFTVDCLSEFHTVAFQLSVFEGGDINGVPYLQAGNPIMCGIYTTEGDAITTFFSPMPHSNGTEWIVFDFTGDQLILEPGEYFAAMRTFDDKCAGVIFNSSDHGPGYKVTQVDSNPWSFSPTSDLNHEIVMTDSFVENEDAGWGEIKSMFR
jgi:hypothetical protein